MFHSTEDCNLSENSSSGISSDTSIQSMASLSHSHAHTTESKIQSKPRIPFSTKKELLLPETVFNHSSMLSAPELKPQVPQVNTVSFEHMSLYPKASKVSLQEQKVNCGTSNECSSRENLSHSSVPVTRNHQDLLDNKSVKPLEQCDGDLNLARSSYKPMSETSKQMVLVLKPVLKKLICQNPEAVAFRCPDYDNFKNYREIVKDPMCFSIVEMKLDSRMYEDAWGFVKDVWLIFNNAMLYFSRSSRNYKYAVKLSELFKDIIDRPMQYLGYCCGQQYSFEPRPISCYNKINCFILKNDKYNFCKRCISLINENIFEVITGTEHIIVRKDQLVQKRNNTYREELFVVCKNCLKKFHKICVLHIDEIWTTGYICKRCLSPYSLRKKIPDHFTSNSLPETNLSTHLEQRVNNYLKMMNVNTQVIIRVVCQDNRESVVQEGAKSRFVESGVWPKSFPYVFKTILAFQKYDGFDVASDVCFFSMFIQEYTSNCSQPNARRVYISYLDSVHFFTPKSHRTSVYHELILAYLEDVKKRGFTTAHLWSCPSNSGEDYIFYCHPSSQKNPTVKRLQDWYKQMLNKGIKSGIVLSYQSLFKQVTDDKLNSVSQLPYFDGDYWPGIIENEIFKLDGKSEKVIKSVQRSVMLEVKNEDGKEILPSDMKSSSCKKPRKTSRYSRNLSLPVTENVIMDNIYEILLKHKTLFLVIHLRSEEGVTTDPDPPIHSNLFSTRESFLDFCRVKDCEFSSLRRAKFSTMAFLYELHKEKIEGITCNICKLEIKTGKHCKVCKDFDLCLNCYNGKGHCHDVEDLKTGFEESVTAGYEKTLAATALAQSKRVAAHVSLCSNANCMLRECRQFREDEKHVRMEFSNGRKWKECKTCTMYLSTVRYHSLNCQYNLCRIFFCPIFRNHQSRKSQLSAKIGSPGNQTQVPANNSSFSISKPNVDGLTDASMSSQLARGIKPDSSCTVDSNSISSLSCSMTTNHSFVPPQSMEFKREDLCSTENNGIKNVDSQHEFKDVPDQCHILQTKIKPQLESNFGSKLYLINKTESGASPSELKYSLPQFRETKQVPGVLHNKGYKMQFLNPNLILGQEPSVDKNLPAYKPVLSSPQQGLNAQQTHSSNSKIISFKPQLSSLMHSNGYSVKMNTTDSHVSSNSPVCGFLRDSGEMKQTSIHSSANSRMKYIIYVQNSPSVSTVQPANEQPKNINVITEDNNLPVNKTLNSVENILSKSGVNIVYSKGSIKTEKNAFRFQCDNTQSVKGGLNSFQTEDVKSELPTGQPMQHYINATSEPIYLKTLPNSSLSVKMSIPQNTANSNTCFLSNLVQPAVYNLSSNSSILTSDINLQPNIVDQCTDESKTSKNPQSSDSYATVPSSQLSTYVFNSNSVSQEVSAGSKKLKVDANVSVTPPNVYYKKLSNGGGFTQNRAVKYFVKQKVVGGTNPSNSYTSAPCTSMPNTALLNIQGNQLCSNQVLAPAPSHSSQNYVTLQLINTVQPKNASLKRKQYCNLIPDRSKKMYKIAKVKNIGTPDKQTFLPMQYVKSQPQTGQLPSFSVLKTNARFS